MECQYHKKIHEENEYSHIDCVEHGHCLNPVQCPLFKTCPTHIGEKDALSWISFFNKKL